MAEEYEKIFKESPKKTSKIHGHRTAKAVQLIKTIREKERKKL